MTAPTPEQMRALAERLDAQAKALGDYWDFMTANERRLLQDSAAALRSAADQLEAVQDVFASASEAQVVEVVLAAATGRDRLRAIVNDAPHEWSCTTRWRPKLDSLCTCWKANIR